MASDIFVDGQILSNRNFARPAVKRIRPGTLDAELAAIKRNDNRDVVFTLGKDHFVASDPTLDVGAIKPGQVVTSPGREAGRIVHVDSEPVDIDPEKAARAIERAYSYEFADKDKIAAALLEALDHADTHLPYSGSVDRVYHVAAMRMYPGGQQIFARAIDRYINRFTGLGGLKDIGVLASKLSEDWPEFKVQARRALEKAIDLAGPDGTSRYELGEISKTARELGMPDVAVLADERLKELRQE